MAARAYWQGKIRLALASIPAEFYAATGSGASISFRQIHEPNGKPINCEMVVQGIGPVHRDEIVKGYEVSKGNYVLLEEDEIEAARVKSRRTLDIVRFVDSGEIDAFCFEKPYHVLPADDLAEEAFIVLRDALKKANEVGIGQISARGRETLVCLKPCGKGQVMETLHYEDEVRKAQGYLRDIPGIKPDEELLELATALIEKKQKAKGKKIPEDVEGPAPASRGGNVIDLMAALRKSVGEEKSRTRKKRPARKTASKEAARAKKRA